MQKNQENKDLKKLPLIPLRDLVVFPSTLVPFIIGRNSSVTALEKASSDEKLLFLATQLDASLNDPQPMDIYSIGVLAKIIRVVKIDDKNLKVIVEGKERSRIIEYTKLYPYYEVLAKEIKQTKIIDDESLNESLKRVLSLFEDYLKLTKHSNFDSIIPALRENTPERISDIIASHLNINIDEKQNLLETINPLERVRRLNFVIESEILKIHSKMRKDVKSSSKKGKLFPDRGQKIFTTSMGQKKDKKANEYYKIDFSIELKIIRPSLLPSISSEHLSG